MSAKQQNCNPEKLMLFLFPLITLGLFLLGVVAYFMIPKLLELIS